MRDDGQSPCGHVTALIGQHLADIERRLAELRETAPPCASWPSGRPRPTPTPAARTGSAPSSCRTDGATPALTNGRRSSTTTCSPSPSRSRTRASHPGDRQEAGHQVREERGQEPLRRLALPSARRSRRRRGGRGLAAPGPARTHPPTQGPA
ncbi:hypothetical protein [Streptomyces sp. NPDC059979]|uniref:hypothetical protein n=1 Tax=Streptomyces sp. NPDC059979 TaxID=3347021 RepID=UPI0036B04DA5